MRRIGLSCFLLAALLAVPSLGRSQEETTEDKPASTTPTYGGREHKTVKLPAAAEDIIVAGSGKYLIAHLKTVQKLAIVDVKEAKVLKYIPVSSPDILFAAGAESFFIVLPDQNIIQRWSLTSLEREVAVPLPAGGIPGTLVMGHASLGPILLASAGENFNRSFTLLNAKTLQPLPQDKGNRNGRNFECYKGCIVRASANGQVFTSWRTGVSPSGFFTLVLGSGQPETFYEHESLGMLSPNFDGSRIYTSGGIYNNKTNPVTVGREGRGERGSLLPSVTGDYYLKVVMAERRSRKEQGSSVSLFLSGDTRPIVTIPDVIPATDREAIFDRRGRMMIDKRIFYFPDLSTLAVVNDADDGIDMVKLDLQQELDKSEIDYLFVSSKPPLAAVAGKPLEYQVVAKSKKGGVKIKLESGPEGMKVDEKGKLTWTVPADAGGDVDVILAISDSTAQEVFHTFRITVGGATAAATSTPNPSAVATNGKPSLQLAPPPLAPPKTGGSSPATAAAPPPTTKLGITPAKFEGEKLVLKLPAAAEKVEVGGGGRFLILYLKSLRKLAVVDLCEAKIAGYIPADDNNVMFAAGADKLVLVLGEKNLITRWSLSTLQRDVTAPLDGRVNSLAMGSASAGPIVVTQGDTRLHSVGLKLYDLAKLRPLDISLPQQLSVNGGLQPRVSADGRTICVIGSFGLTAFLFDGRGIQAKQSDRSGNGPGLGVPGPDGQVIYAGSSRFSQSLRQLSKPEQGSAAMLIPATHGRLYLSVQFSFDRDEDKAKQKLGVHIEGDSRPLVTLEGFDLSGANGDFYGQQSIPLDKRLVLVPDAKVIASLSSTFDQIELRRFDLDAALEAAGIDYLFVASRPPVQVKPNEAVNYQVEVKSKKGGVQYRLESGPEGMKLSPTGLLTWKAPGPTAEEAQHSVILAISDSSGQEVFHTFQIAIEGAAPKIAAKPAGGSSAGLMPGMPGVGGLLRPGKSSTPVPHREQVEEFAEEKLEMDDPFPAKGQPKSPVRPVRPAPSPYAKLIGKQRTWTEAASQKKIDATFMGMEAGKVKIVTPDKKEFAIPVERLSREDLIWVLGGQVPAAEPEPKTESP